MTVEDFSNAFGITESEATENVEIDEYGDPISQDFEEEQEIVEETETDSTKETTESDLDADADRESEDKPETDENGKKKQSKEENARFAEMRRQKQIEERVQVELERIRQSSPEYQMAQLLSQTYGMPVEDLYKQLQEATLAKQAEEQKVPVEVLKRIQEQELRQQQLEDQLVQERYKQWQNKTSAEIEALKKEYPMLDDQDFESAVQFILTDVKNPEFPLRQAINALYTEKIQTGLRDSLKNEILAELSGRKKGTLPPQGGKPQTSETLTEQERYFAKALGISEEDYIKYK